MDANPYEPPTSKLESETSEVNSRPGQSLACLFAALLIIGLGTMMVPRITPPGGLVGFDFLLMLGLPIGAYRAAKEWFNSVVFLVYGALGMFLLIPGYLSDGRLKFKLATQADVITHGVFWCVGVLVVSAACCWVGKTVQSTPHRGASPAAND